MAKRLTPLQRRLLREIEYLLDACRLNHRAAVENFNGIDLTTALEHTKAGIIRGEVVLMYTLMDLLIETLIAYYFFTGTKNLRRSKRFKRFLLLMEEISLMQKLRMLKAVRKVPRALASSIERLNAVRNSLVHRFSPEEAQRNKAIYRGQNIFEIPGFNLFKQDMADLLAYFHPRARRRGA